MNYYQRENGNIGAFVLEHGSVEVQSYKSESDGVWSLLGVDNDRTHFIFQLSDVDTTNLSSAWAYFDLLVEMLDKQNVYLHSDKIVEYRSALRMCLYQRGLPTN